MAQKWWKPVTLAKRREQQSRNRFSPPPRSRAPRLEVLEDRIALSDASAGVFGINARNLTTPGGTVLTGAEVSVGQVEPYRPGMPGFDTDTNLIHDSVRPVKVAVVDGAATVNDVDPKSWHAEAVAGVIIANGTTNKGVAPQASLYASAASGQVDTALAFQNLIGLAGGKLRVMNYSSGEYLADGQRLDGNSTISQFIDYSAQKDNVLYVVAGLQQGRNATWPAGKDEFNGLTVAATQKDANGVYDQVESAEYNSPDQATVDGRRMIDLVAPGIGIAVPVLGNEWSNRAAGTSFAAPHVAGAAALLQQYAADRNAANEAGFIVTGSAIRHEVIKAVLMNSADKLEDTGDGLLLGMEKTIYKKDGTTWLQSDARDSADNLRGDLVPLDSDMGTGQLNVKRAVQQFAPGEQNVNLNEPAIGWNLEYISADTPGGVQKYGFANKLKGGSYVSLTMAWDRQVTLNDANSNGQYDAAETFTAKPPVDLELYLMPKDATSIVDAVWSSRSGVDNVEHIFFKLPPGDAKYEFWVKRFQASDPPVTYAIAWWAMQAPEVLGPPTQEGTVRGRIWQDSTPSADGVQNSGEAGLVNVLVTLTPSSGSALSTHTDSFGNYAFTDVALGTYVVSVPTPSLFVPSGYHQGGDGFLDSDIDAMTGAASVTLTASDPTAVLDAGFVALAATTTTLSASAAASTSGQAVTLTATVTPASGGSTPSGTVTFYDDGVAIGTSTLAQGATAMQATLTTSDLSLGYHGIVAVYSGSPTSSASTSPAQGEAVRQPEVFVSLSGSSPTSTVGAALTFTAVVSPPSSGANPTGTVTFFDGDDELGTVNLSAVTTSYQASLTTSTLGAGGHVIIAVYSGDATYASGASSAFAATVLGTTTTAVTASVNPTLVAQAVVFTATVTSALTGTPGGSVVFTDNGTVMGNGVSAGNGVWTFTTSALAKGSHPVTATYSGDANYASSAGSVTQTVNPVTSYTSVVNSSAIPSYVNDAVTFSVSVGNDAGVANYGDVTFTDDTNGTNLGTVAGNGSGVWSLTTSALTKGSHDITASYGGSSYFAPSVSPSARTQVVLGHTSYAGVSSSSATSYVGSTVVLTVSVGTSPGLANADDGTVTFFDNGVAIQGNVAHLSTGYWTLSTSFSTPGYHSLTATYGGNSYFAASTSSAFTQDVIQPSTTGIVSSTGPSSVGDAVTFTVSVGGSTGAASSGTVSFYDTVNSATSLLGTGTTNGNGVWTLTTTGLVAGSHTVTASYGGNSYFAASQSPSALTQIVYLNTSTTSVVGSSVNSSSVGDSVTFTVHVAGSAGAATSGTVSFYDGATLLGTGGYTATGYWSLVTSGLSAGTHTITASYGGNSFYSASSSAFTQTVNLNPSYMSVVNTSASPTYVGDPVTFTVSVGTAAGLANANNGTVTFYDNGVSIGTGTYQTPGYWHLTITNQTAGSHNITASYGGNSYFAASSSPSALALNVIALHPSFTSVVNTSESPAYTNDAVTFTVSVGNASGAANANNGTVTFFDNGVSIGTGTYQTPGYWHLTVSNLTAGSHSITASYGGNTYFAASSSSSALSLNVISGHPSFTGVVNTSESPAYTNDAVTFTVSVGNASGTANADSGTVTFFDNGVSIGTGTYQTPGYWHLTTSSLTAGSHSITASFGGTSYFAASSSSLPLSLNVISGHPSTTSVVNASASPAYVGDAVTLSVNVGGSAGAANSGTVTFYDGANVLGNGTTTGNGVWTLTTSFATIGSVHNITASYGGSSYFAASSSPSSLVLSVTGHPSVTSTVSSSANSSGVGQSVTFLVTVSGTAGMANTGTVEFYDGANLLGTGTTTGNGVWWLSFSTLGVGNHSISAHYLGNAYFAGSYSATLTQVVHS